jgi:hypothetical protein
MTKIRIPYTKITKEQEKKIKLYYKDIQSPTRMISHLINPRKIVKIKNLKPGAKLLIPMHQRKFFDILNLSSIIDEPLVYLTEKAFFDSSDLKKYLQYEFRKKRGLYNLAYYLINPIANFVPQRVIGLGAIPHKIGNRNSYKETRKEICEAVKKDKTIVIFQRAFRPNTKFDKDNYKREMYSIIATDLYKQGIDVPMYPFCICHHRLIAGEEIKPSQIIDNEYSKKENQIKITRTIREGTLNILQKNLKQRIYEKYIRCSMLE